MELVLPQNYVEIEQEEMMYLDGGGKVGLNIHFGPNTRKLSGWAAGTFAGGYVGFHLKPLIATGPVGAGAAALISGAVVYTVKWAIENGLKSVFVGTSVPILTWTKNVYLP